MVPSRLVVIGGSAGAIPTLLEIVKDLPAGFPAAILVVIHVSPTTRSVLPALLSRAGPLPAHHPTEPEPLRPGHIYVAPPDEHLLVEGPAVVLRRGPRENHHRPAIDATFRSAAASFEERTIALLLSGFLDDGTAGCVVVKNLGGQVLIQDPNDTLFPDMPTNALSVVEPDRVLRVGEMAAALVEAVRKPVADPATSETAAVALRQARQGARKETGMDEVHDGAHNLREMPGKISALVCPECKGTLWEIEEGELVRYRCHEGHAYSPMSLIAGQTEALEAALWTALRTLDEKLAFAESLAERARSRGQSLAAKSFTRQAHHAAAHAAVIRTVLRDRSPGPAPEKLEELTTSEAVGKSESSKPLTDAAEP